MSIYENLQVFQDIDVERFLHILKTEYGARRHPTQPGAYLIGNRPLPFYEPRIIDGHLSIMSFNYLPLPYALLEVLLEQPGLVIDTSLLRWTQEQELILEKTAGQLRQKKQ